MRSKKFVIISFIFGFLIIALGIYSNSNGANINKSIQQSELTSIIGTLELEPIVKESKSGPHVSIRLEEYSNFVFNVGGANFKALNNGFTSEIIKGDTIQLDILTYDYDTKIKKTKKLTLSERIINYKFISPFAIYSKGKFYMKLEDTNREIEHDRVFGFWFFSFAALIYLIYSILYWTGSIKRFSIWWNRMQASR